jgi:hypothetical protein
MRNAAILSISYQELKERLGIPDDVSLVAIVQGSHAVMSGQVMIVFENPNLPACLEAAEPIHLTVEQIIEATSDNG